MQLRQERLTGSCHGTMRWTLSGGPLTFKMTSGKFGGTDYLHGTLKLLALTEVPNGKLFSETMTLELPSPVAVRSSFSDDHGDVVFNVQTETTKSLAISPAGRGIQGILESGDMNQAPEPGSMALLGSGFLLVGGFLRRKFLH